MKSEPENARDLLDAAYTDLGLAEGDLMEATERPTPATLSAWVEKGEWLALAKQVGAEKIFFVENNPVVVFAAIGKDDPDHWLSVFNRVWCMARPQLLFLARDGELSVFNLTKMPAREQDDASRAERLLATVETAAKVQEKLQRYRRDQLESGLLFEDERFGYDNRADHALVRDLKEVRKALLKTGLAVEHAHALIGRSIFIRYLEDRNVLIPEYFHSVADEKKRKGWNALVDRVLPDAYLPEEERPVYPRVLADKDFTYALFKRLAKDFNGDMFPISKKEEDEVTVDHLTLLQSFLLGQAGGATLFFFAYRFDIIPIELISSIYEEFYGVERGKSQKQGSFYTPSSLVEFVLSHTLTDAILEQRPRVMDPACGSGIFLVETFRRLVRHRMKQLGRRLRPNELRKILREQIAGIDINPEAVRVAAFSLYLALLHYQEPRDILQTKLPSLTYEPRDETDPELHFDILVASDAFHIADKVAEAAVCKRFGTGSASIVVGNPPWGDPQMPDALTTEGKRGAMDWCDENEREIGNKELSQAFIHRTLDLLSEGGRAGLLVSTGVFFKRHEKSRAFRKQWLESASLEHVVNFAAVRDTFFSGPSHKEGAIAPFASVVFTKQKPVRSNRFAYWSAKKTAFIERVQVVVLSRADVRIVRQDKFLANDELWKIYWWGSHRDEALLEGLSLEPTFGDVVGPDEDRIRVGYQEAVKNRDDADWLSLYKEFPTKEFRRYGPLPKNTFKGVPPLVHRRGDRTTYEGLRLLIGRGVAQRGHQKGRIIARLETEPFCFRDSIYGVPLSEFDEATGKVLLGILWSSMSRYYLFMQSGTWGTWHHELKKDAIQSIPVRVPTSSLLRKRIGAIVDSLRSYNPNDSLFGPKHHSTDQRDPYVENLEFQLDEAIFDLYELSDSERDLVFDMCEVGLDLFYRGMESEAVGPAVDWSGSRCGHSSDLAAWRRHTLGIEGYLAAFLEVWEPELARSGGQFRWWVVRPDEVSPMLAAVFSTETKEEPLPEPSPAVGEAWQQVLEKLGNASVHAFHSKRVFIDGMVRVVTENDIVLIKRNERRLWTRSAAREDAEATLHQIIRKQHTAGPGEVTSVPAQPL